MGLLYSTQTIFDLEFLHHDQIHPLCFDITKLTNY